MTLGKKGDHKKDKQAKEASKKEKKDDSKKHKTGKEDKSKRKSLPIDFRVISHIKEEKAMPAVQPTNETIAETTTRNTLSELEVLREQKAKSDAEKEATIARLQAELAEANQRTAELQQLNAAKSTIPGYKQKLRDCIAHLKHYVDAFERNAKSTHGIFHGTTGINRAQNHLKTWKTAAVNHILKPFFAELDLCLTQDDTSAEKLTAAFKKALFDLAIAARDNARNIKGSQWKHHSYRSYIYAFADTLLDLSKRDDLAGELNLRTVDIEPLAFDELKARKNLQDSEVEVSELDAADARRRSGSQIR